MAVPQIDALQLRALAETASSWRARGGDPMYGVLVDNAEGAPVLDVQPHLTEPANAVVEFDTADVQPAREIIDILLLGKLAVLTAANAYDAVFMSEAAVEKFVLPYYASKSLWLGASVLQTLATLWYGFLPGSNPVVTSTEPIPFALAHLPGSDYVGVTGDGPTLGSDLHLLFLQDGEVNPVPLSTYLTGM
jgi:hypothetical protein